MLRGASFLADRIRLSNRLGIGTTFDGKRNVDEALGYQPTLTTYDYRKRYARNPVAARVVEAGPKGTWRSGCELIETETPDVMTPFETAMDQLAVRLNIWQRLMRTDMLAGLGRYAVILIGATGNLDTPLPKMRGQQDVLYLTPYAEDEMLIMEYEEDTSSERFGLPTRYQLTRAQASATSVSQAGGPSRGRPQLTRPVHWTRVVHFADHVLDDQVFGAPRLERVWNKLDDLDKVTGGGAEAFWQNANRGIQFDVDPLIAVGDEERRELEEQADLFMHGQRRSMRTRGVKINPLGTDTAEFASNAMAILQQISSGTGIPLRILIGAEAGELSSTQDRSNWNDRVNDRRIESAEPFVRDFVDRLIAVGAVPAPKSYKVQWARPEDMTEFERTEAASKMASANKDMVEATGLPIMTVDEMRDRYLHAGPLPDEVVNEAKQREEDARQAEIDAQAARSQQKPAATPAKRAAEELREIVGALDEALLSEALQGEARELATGIVADALT